MRTEISALLAAGIWAAALTACVGGAGAATVPGVGTLYAAAEGLAVVEPVRTICRRYWNGYRWRTRCWRVPDDDGYWAPRPWRRRPPPGH